MATVDVKGLSECKWYSRRRNVFKLSGKKCDRQSLYRCTCSGVPKEEG